MKPQTSRNVPVADFENAHFYVKANEEILDIPKGQICKDTELIDDGMDDANQDAGGNDSEEEKANEAE